MRTKPAAAIKGAGSYSSTTVYYEDIPHLSASTLTGAAVSLGNLDRTGRGGCVRIDGTYGDSPSHGKFGQVFSAWGTDGGPTGDPPDSRLELSAEL